MNRTDDHPKSSDEKGSDIEPVPSNDDRNGRDSPYLVGCHWVERTSYNTCR